MSTSGNNSMDLSIQTEKISINDTIQQLIEVLEESIKKSMADAILFSGGIDTSVLAALTYRYSKIPLVTIVFKEAFSSDLQFSTMVAKHLGAEQHIKYFEVDEAVQAAHKVIRILEVFDPMEIRNSIPIYIGLEFCKKMGYHVVMTGDGSDELFAGYSFLFEKSLREIDEWIQNIVKTWSFSSSKLAKSLKIVVRQPYTSEDVVKLALRIPIQYKVLKKNNAVIGKYVLRKIAEKYLPKEVAWRSKDPIEVGSGANILSTIFAQMVSDEELNKLSKEVKLRNKEQAFYFKIFKTFGCDIPKAKNTSNACKYCGAEISNKFCRICGAYPAI